MTAGFGNYEDTDHLAKHFGCYGGGLSQFLMNYKVDGSFKTTAAKGSSKEVETSRFSMKSRQR